MQHSGRNARKLGVFEGNVSILEDTQPDAVSSTELHKYSVVFKPPCWPYDWAAPKHGMFLHTFMLTVLYRDGCLYRIAGQESSLPGQQNATDVHGNHLRVPVDQISTVPNSIDTRQQNIHNKIVDANFQTAAQLLKQESTPSRQPQDAINPPLSYKEVAYLKTLQQLDRETFALMNNAEQTATQKRCVSWSWSGVRSGRRSICGVWL